MDFSVGSLVQHKTRPYCPLAVERIEYGSLGIIITCSWFDYEGRSQTGMFSASVLETYVSRENPSASVADPDVDY